ncbi:hypothetical protein PMZ80_003262 [Knufia obscura]|uniref:RSE1/DDB1/CPSF1 first beta-propeller domain-containing protein n=2 Tax=Knufia TaxID=430999 RepID=A0AAN8EA82_9EURO|nr:hypothetical protein PMZ80_003262 [Knufia obscura]KAK5950379.1 hypothetical protein OHC33_008598 [Knufia fluminis]
MDQDSTAGVLSQTLASSPCIKSILPARIRSPLLNDVVLVGHSSIHLREFMQSTALSNIIADLELGVQILSAKVISAEEYVLSTEDAILENGRDEIRYKIRGQPCDDSQPPQIVVLSTALGELVYVYAKTLLNGSVQFVHARRQILGDGYHWPRKYGKQLVVDPQSRALAVASAKNHFGIMALKDIDQIKDEIDSWDPRNPLTILPIKEQRFFKVDGVILRMDFLRSSVEEPDRVFLLLIIANQGVTRLLLYRWDKWRPLTTVKPQRCSGQPLPPEDAFPHLLIPSCKGTSFAIVSGQKIVFYDNVNAKSMRRHPVKIPKDNLPNDKLWVQYAKPFRHEEHKKRKEDIFLIREDGTLKTVVVTHTSSSQTSIAWEPGHLGMNVDTAVCALSAPPTVGGDILIACGDMTEGGVFHLAARQSPLRLQGLSNWSPIRDVVHIDRKAMSSMGHDHGIVLAATGLHENRAALTELRYGLEAHVVSSIAYNEADTIDRLWVVERHSERRILLVASHHEHTTILSYEIETAETIALDSQSCPQLCFNEPTLVACWLPGDVVLQITATQVNVLGASAEDQVHQLAQMRGDYACADVLAPRGLFVAVRREGTSLELVGGITVAKSEIEPELALLPGTLSIDYVPVDVKLADAGGRTICLCGSLHGHLHMSGIDPERGFTSAKTWSLSDFTRDLDDTHIASIATLSLNGARSVLVLCGLKNGRLMLFELVVPPAGSLDSAGLLLKHEQSLGTTAVVVKVEAETLMEDERTAYATCGSSLLRVHLHRTKYGLDYTIDRLVITDKARPSYIPAKINAIDRMGRLQSSENDDTVGLVICVVADEISFLRIGQTALMPRSIRAMHPTKHLVYSSLLRKCITSVQGRTASGADDDGEQQTERPSLHILDPNTAAEHETPLPKSRFFFGEKGEKIRVLLDWTPTDGTFHFDMIIIGSDHNATGRLSYMSANRMSQPKTGGSARLIATYPKKSISAVCAYGMSSLVVCAGRELKLLYLDIPTKRFQNQGEIELPSRATELRTKGSVIYVATSLHSFMLVREENGKLTLMESDEWASKARNIIPHGNGSTLVNLVSDHGSRLLNFSERPTKGTRPTFEARMPQAIDRLNPLKISSMDDQRGRFVATTVDGTVYLLTTLTEAEMKLLCFLEQLCEPIKYRLAKNMGILAQAMIKEKGAKLESLGRVPPSLGDTHARGDVLRRLLEPGPYNIHFLLQRRIKLEEEDAMVKLEDELESLKDVARPVLGSTEDVVEAVVVWLRRLLNVPSF